MEKMKVAICDDMPEICGYYQRVIEAQPDMQVVGSANKSIECRNLVTYMRPDVLLLDIQMESVNAGIALISVVKQICPKMKVIMLTVQDEDEYIFDALAEGADEYILKTSSDEDVLAIIRGVYNESHVLRSEIVKRSLRVCNTFKRQRDSLLYFINIFMKLSPTELGILHDVYEGMAYKHIAGKRFIEENTVRAHISRILKKFGYTNMKLLVASLKEMQIFDLFKDVDFH